MSVISKELVQTLLKQYVLPWKGIHGVSHWARVFENGCQLAQITQAKMDVVHLFALFHDIKRTHEGWEAGHGYRGANYAASLRGHLFQLTDEDFNLLRIACTHHTDGLVEADVTVQTCWDADRLDLGRVNLSPKINYLCTQAAKDSKLINWATERAERHVLPEFVDQEWGIKFRRLGQVKHV